MPADLSTWTGSMELVRLVLEAASLNANLLEKRDFRMNGAAFRPPTLLSLLAYAYLSGINGSRDIEAALGSNRGLRYLAANTAASGAVLRQFRRLNRAVLKKVLVNVLRTVWEDRFSKDDLSASTGFSYVTQSLDRWLEPLRHPSFEADAEDRIRQAIMADSMALDE
jgi:hypothetical protein